MEKIYQSCLVFFIKLNSRKFSCQEECITITTTSNNKQQQATATMLNFVLELVSVLFLGLVWTHLVWNYYADRRNRPTRDEWPTRNDLIIINLTVVFAVSFLLTLFWNSSVTIALCTIIIILFRLFYVSIVRYCVYP